jgi:hypothetical protein
MRPTNGTKLAPLNRYNSSLYRYKCRQTSRHIKHLIWFVCLKQKCHLPFLHCRGSILIWKLHGRYWDNLIRFIVRCVIFSKSSLLFFWVSIHLAKPWLVKFCPFILSLKASHSLTDQFFYFHILLAWRKIWKLCSCLGVNMYLFEISHWLMLSTFNIHYSTRGC